MHILFIWQSFIRQHVRRHVTLCDWKIKRKREQKIYASFIKINFYRSLQIWLHWINKSNVFTFKSTKNDLTKEESKLCANIEYKFPYLKRHKHTLTHINNRHSHKWQFLISNLPYLTLAISFGCLSVGWCVIWLVFHHLLNIISSMRYHAFR